MYKNKTMCWAEVDEVTFSDLVYLLCKGNDIVFITEKDKLLGGVTSGDLNRKMKEVPSVKDKYIEIRPLVNMGICRLVQTKETSIEEAAKEIFNNRKSIHNIPIVDESGKLLYQIDRYEETRKISSVLNKNGIGALRSLIDSHSINRLILTGSDKNSLQLAKRQVEELCEGFEQMDIRIDVVEDIRQCGEESEDVLIISLSNLGVLYIKELTGYRAQVFSLNEIIEINNYADILTIDNQAVRNLKHLFGYETIIFGASNFYIRKIREVLDVSGIRTYLPEDYYSVDKKYIPSNSLDIVALSGNNVFADNISIAELLDIIKELSMYIRIVGCELTEITYISACVEWLYVMKRNGFEGLCLSIFNTLDDKLYENLKRDKSLLVVNNSQHMLPNVKYVVDRIPFRYESKNVFWVNIKQECIKLLLYKRVYELVKSKYNNVYVLQVPINGMDCCWERTRPNYYMRHNIFPENFVKDMYGDANYPIEKLLDDIAGCEVVNVCDGYMKFQSNYHSEYFNTDIYGNREVSDVPLEYCGTIWLAGGCIFSGYAVEDNQTVASFLQSKINNEDLPYRVVNLSVDGAIGPWYLYQKILEQNVASNDIIILCEVTLREIESKIIKIDYEEIQKQFVDQTWYWDIPRHSSAVVYEKVTDMIFDQIKGDLSNHTGKYTFRVESSLENQIHGYITDVKYRINRNSFYQMIYNSKCERDIKVGAIVMNCNPFTYGHQYLVEIASKLVDVLYLFVVEENRSIFPFDQRFYMVEEGVKQYQNVIVVPSGKFMISALTFPGYFMKDNPTRSCYDSFLDLKIFAHYVAPALGIKNRFVGCEPFDKVTAQYNHDMKIILQEQDIMVIEIPRKTVGNEVISATAVRKLLKKKNWEQLKQFVPESTLKVLVSQNF